MNWFTLAWILWGLAFAVIEGIAVFNSRAGDTLSEHVWAFFGIDRVNRRNYDKPRAVTPVWTLRIARIVLLSFMVWLTVHFVSGGWV